MDDVLTFLLGVLLEGMEVSLVIFHDDLVHYKFLHIIRGFLTDIDEEDKRFEEVLLLSEVIVILLTGNLERIHGDWPFLGVGDIGSLVISADTFIGVTCIDQHNVGVLDQQLTNHAVHVERLTTTRWPDTQEIGIVGMLDLTLLTREVDTDGQSVAVCVIDQQR